MTDRLLLLVPVSRIVFRRLASHMDFFSGRKLAKNEVTVVDPL